MQLFVCLANIVLFKYYGAFRYNETQVYGGGVPPCLVVFCFDLITRNFHGLSASDLAPSFRCYEGRWSCIDVSMDGVRLAYYEIASA